MKLKKREKQIKELEELLCDFPSFKDFKETRFYEESDSFEKEHKAFKAYGMGSDGDCFWYLDKGDYTFAVCVEELYEADKADYSVEAIIARIGDDRCIARADLSYCNEERWNPKDILGDLRIGLKCTYSELKKEYNNKKEQDER